MNPKSTALILLIVGREETAASVGPGGEREEGYGGHDQEKQGPEGHGRMVHRDPGAVYFLSGYST